MKYKNLTLNIEHNPQLHQQFLTLEGMIPFIPELDALIDEATQRGSITIDFVRREESPTGGHISQTGTIDGQGRRTISRNIKIVSEDQNFADMFFTLVFELCNAKNPFFGLFSSDGIHPEEFDRDSFAYMKESAEYSETHVPSRKILRDIFSNPQTLALFRAHGIILSRDDIFQLTHDAFRDFEHWWQHCNVRQPGQPLSHADTYRHEHDQIMANQLAELQFEDSPPPRRRELPQTPARRQQPAAPTPVAPARRHQPAAAPAPIIHAQRREAAQCDEAWLAEIYAEENGDMSQAEIMASIAAMQVNRNNRPN
ncbi:MAG: hypothetical protein AB7I18_07730 [Candidatus Berkiella sp.]